MVSECLQQSKLPLKDELFEDLQKNVLQPLKTLSQEEAAGFEPHWTGRVGDVSQEGDSA